MKHMPERKYLRFVLIVMLVLAVNSSFVNGSNIVINNNNVQKAQELGRNYYRPYLAINDTNDTLPSRPLLAIKKVINVTELEPLQWIRIDLNITNIGNRTAYNLSITEPNFEEWAVSTFNLTKQKYIQVEINASFVYTYYIQPLVEGNFTLEATEINYYDENSVMYKSYSQRYSLHVILPENVEVIDSEKWLNLFFFVLGIIGVFTAIIIVDLFAIQKIHKRRRSSKKISPLVKKPQKTKQEQKRKIKKRKRRK